MLPREEYVEQAHFFGSLCERIVENISTQDLLASIREEILATTKLPMALDFLLDELKHSGVLGSAMERLSHYFTPYQTYLINEAELERGRFDVRIALEILRLEAEYRSEEPSRQGIFLYQFESLCRNRLRYDQGLDAISADPIFDQAWSDWIQSVRRRIGMADLADLIYIESEFYQQRQAQKSQKTDAKAEPLFGEREGRIALANRHKDPLLLFEALHRQLGYPRVPRPKPIDQSPDLLPQLARRMERLESRVKLMEEEQRGGIDLAKYYSPPKKGKAVSRHWPGKRENSAISRDLRFNCPCDRGRFRESGGSGVVSI